MPAKQKMHDDVGLTLQEFARRLGVSEITARRICKKGEITYRIIKGRYVIKYGDYKVYQDQRLFIAKPKGKKK